MHKYFFILLAFFHLAIQAQNQPKPQSKQTTVAPAYIGKTWKIYSIEEFGVVKAPAKKNINDLLQLNTDNSFVLRVDSVDVIGKYTRSGKSLVLKTEVQSVYYITVLKDVTDTLTIQCKSPDLITSVFKYTSAK